MSTRENFPAKRIEDLNDVELTDAELYFGSDEQGLIPLDEWDALTSKERRAVKRQYRQARRRAVYSRARDAFLSRDSLDEESRLFALAGFLEESWIRRVVATLLAVMVVVLMVVFVFLISQATGAGSGSSPFVPISHHAAGLGLGGETFEGGQL